MRVRPIKMRVRPSLEGVWIQKNEGLIPKVGGQTLSGEVSWESAFPLKSGCPRLVLVLFDPDG